jgi:hypothetical protein
MVARQKPAEVNLKGVKRIAILDVAGDGGDELEGLLTEQLTASKRFDVLERAQIDKVLTEQGYTVKGDFQEGDVKLGQLVPASALVSGKVIESTYKENLSKEASTCMTIDGKKHPCVNFTRSGKATLQTQVKVFDTTTGKILAAKVLKSASERKTTSTDAPPEPIDGSAMISDCRRSVSDEFLHLIAPYSVQEKVQLVETSDLPDLNQGNEYLKRGDNQTAVELYGKAVAKADADATLSPKIKGRAHYALGLGLAIVSDYPSALTELKKANMLYQESSWLDMEVRVKQWSDEAARLEQQKKDSEAKAPGDAPAAPEGEGAPKS